MQLSEPINVTFRGQPAQLRVLRNDGCCWGHLTLPDGTEFDVDPSIDLYPKTDEQAQEHLLKCMQHTGNIEPAARRLGLPFVGTEPAPAAVAKTTGGANHG